MKRIVDEPYGTYSVYTVMASGIAVKCPHCGGLGVVTADERQAYFHCQSCGAARTKERALYRYDVHNHCPTCGRYYRVDVTQKDQEHFRMLRVSCPYCGQYMTAGCIKPQKPRIIWERLKMPASLFLSWRFGLRQALTASPFGP